MSSLSSQSQVAVIIPVYNRQQEVIEALDSVASQSRRPDVVVVVDDGSTDATSDRVQQWIDRHVSAVTVRLVRQLNQGVSSARNRGVKEAGHCDLLAFLDSDDLWPNDYLERLCAILEKDRTAIAASSDRSDLDPVTGRSKPHSEKSISQNTTQVILCDGPPIPSTTVMRASAFHQAGGFDTTLYAGQEDYHLALKISLLGPWRHCAGAPVIKRIETGRLTGGEQSLVRKHADRLYLRVKMVDRFIFEEGGAAAVPERVWRRRLGSLWYRAGRVMSRLGRIEEARECWDRSAAVDPVQIRARVMRMVPFR
jgi:glycosyltransferase involved in cell wall biosynthesis